MPRSEGNSSRPRRGWLRLLRSAGAALVFALALGWTALGAGAQQRPPVAPSQRATSAAETGYDWPKYEHDDAGSGYTADPAITAQNASTLAARPTWPQQSTGFRPVSAQPIVANGLVYWGSWDGVEHATPVDGSTGGWTVSLGTVAEPSGTACASSGVHGVADSGVIASVTLPDQAQPLSVLFIAGGGNDSAGGGFARMYALNALTGAMLWETDLAPSPDYFMWSSPVVYTPPGQSAPSVYDGVSDVGEPCPEVHGRIVKLDTLTGALQSTLDVVPSGCKGGTVWGSLTVDDAANALFAVTGNGYACRGGEPYATAILKLDPATLTVTDSWKVPKEQRPGDDDFGTVPTLFSGTVTPSGAVRQLVGAPNKNGIFYVWDRTDLAAGPVAELPVANVHAADIAPAAYDGSRLYVATTGTTVGGTTYKGSVQAFDPNDLSAPLWETTLSAPVLASVTAASGIVVVGASHRIDVLDSAAGHILKSLDVEPVGMTKGKLWSAPTIADGVLYEGDSQGFLYAFSPGGV